MFLHFASESIMFSGVAPESNPVFVFGFGVKFTFRILLRNRIRSSSLGANRAIGVFRSCRMLHFSTPESISPLVAACLAQTTAGVSESRSVRLEVGNNAQGRQTPCLWNMLSKISCNRIQHPLSSMLFLISGFPAAPFPPTPFEVPQTRLFWTLLYKKMDNLYASASERPLEAFVA